jgi:regulatory protein
MNKETLDKAQSVAIKFTNYRLRSEQELKIRLLKNFDEAIVKKTISKMYEFGFLDDTRFANIFTESRVISRPRSSTLIKKELLQKGISKETADSAVEEVNDSEMCLILANKKARSLSHLEWSDFQKKMQGYLARKGFNYSTANSAIKKIWPQIRSDLNTN